MHRLLIQLGIDARLSPAQAETLSEALTECGTAKADYLDLQRQHEELKTMLFNERQNAKELAAQVERLQEDIFKMQCFDVDVIRCLKTMAFDHNHADIPLYKHLAKECMDQISSQNRANEIKAQAVDKLCPLKFASIAFRHSDEWPKDIEVDDIKTAFKFMAEELRQQAKAGS